jgi:hypothetical protein
MSFLGSFGLVAYSLPWMTFAYLPVILISMSVLYLPVLIDIGKRLTANCALLLFHLQPARQQGYEAPGRHGSLSHLQRRDGAGEFCVQAVMVQADFDVR